MLTETRTNQDGSLYGFPPTTPLPPSYGAGAEWGGGAPPPADGTATWAYPGPAGGRPPAPGWGGQDTGWGGGPATPWDTTGGWTQGPGMPGQQPAAYGGEPYGVPVSPPYGGPQYPQPRPAYNPPPAAYQPAAPVYQPPPAAYQPPPPAYQPPPPAYGQPPAAYGPPTAYGQPVVAPAQYTEARYTAPEAPPAPTYVQGTATGTQEQEPSLFRLLRAWDERQPPREGSAPQPRSRRDPVEDDEPEEPTSTTAQAAAQEDEALLNDIGKILKLLRIDSLFPRLVYIVLGFGSIGPLALAYIEAIPLPYTAAFVLAPAATIMILLGRKYPKWGKRALIGWVSGIIATILYDIIRLSLVPTGIWDDPIPAIGDLLLVRDEVPWMVGYAWRFFGNGGGMAIAFTMMPWRGVKAGFIYGTLINTGLFIILGVFPVAQEHFFPFTPFTIVGGYIGHWTYGSVLGYLTKKFLPPVQVKLLPEPERDPGRAATAR